MTISIYSESSDEYQVIEADFDLKEIFIGRERQIEDFW